MWLFFGFLAFSVLQFISDQKITCPGQNLSMTHNLKKIKYQLSNSSFSSTIVNRCKFPSVFLANDSLDHFSQVVMTPSQCLSLLGISTKFDKVRKLKLLSEHVSVRLFASTGRGRMNSESHSKPPAHNKTGLMIALAQAITHTPWVARAAHGNNSNALIWSLDLEILCLCSK